MAAVAEPALIPPEEDLEEELEDLPKAEKEADPLFKAKILRAIDGRTFSGEVDDIEVGKQSRDRLYRIKYEDGDLEHLTADEVEESKVEEDLGVSKKPAMSKPKSKGEDKATGKAKAKAKAKATATGKAKPKAKPKAKAKAVVKKPKAKPKAKPKSKK